MAQSRGTVSLSQASSAKPVSTFVILILHRER